MRRRRAAVLWIIVVAYAGIVFYLSSQSVPAPAEETVGLLGDKVLHGLEYGAFAFLLALAIGSTPWPRIRSWTALIALAGAVVYAASDELHQTFVPGRQGDVMDLLADSVGAVLAAAVYEVWRRWSARRVPVSGTSPR